MGAERNEEEREADYEAGRLYAMSEHAQSRRRLEEARLSDLASEAFPFAVVADAHCISRLVDQFKPKVLEQRRRASIVAAEKQLERRRGKPAPPR